MCISMDRDNLLLESDPGSHHVGVQADTVRPATNQPYSFPSQFPIKPVPSIALFQQLPTRQSSTYSFTTTTTTFTTTTKMCKHEMYVSVITSRLSCSNFSVSIGDFYRGCRVCLLVVVLPYAWMFNSP